MTRLFAVVLTFLLVSTATALEDYSALVERLMPAVVNISTKIEPDEKQGQMPQNPFEGTPFEELFRGFNGFNMPMRPQQSLGSGVVLDREGYIVTNNHVVAGADKIVVRFNEDRAEYAAELVGRDPKNDLALLKLADMPRNMATAPLGTSANVKPGQPVLAIGNPFGLGGTVTAGIVSALGRNIGQGPYDDFIQTDAAINPGNSGGPLFNTAGEIIGINTAIFSRDGGSNGIGFAIPVDIVKSIVGQIKEHGRPIRGWLGVRIQTVTPELAESFDLSDDVGALVAEVLPDSPAEAAGIKTGDIILSYQAEKIIEMSDLPRLVAETDVGKTVPVVVLRDGRRRTIMVKIAELEEDFETAERGGVDDEKMPESKLGLALAALTPNLRAELDVPERVDGLVVMNVTYGSPAAEAGLRRGDVIVQANMKPVSGPEDLRKQIDNTQGRALLLRVYRNDGFLFLPLKVDDQ